MYSSDGRLFLLMDHKGVCKYAQIQGESIMYVSVCVCEWACVCVCVSLFLLHAEY